MKPTTSSKESKYLIVILGATAVGKTSTSIALAKQFSAEIISADARQLYKEMTIGTAKPTAAEEAEVPHHFVNCLSLDSPYSAGDFGKEVLNTLEKLWKKSPYAILTGGSALYINAVCEGLPPMPPIPSSIQKALQANYEKEGLPPLLRELAEKDPAYYQIVDRTNPRRILRALAICRTTHRSFSFFRQGEKAQKNFHIIKIGLKRDRPSLHERIRARVDLMLEEGLWEEATALYPYRHLPALKTIGYQEIFSFIDGEYDKKEAIERIKIHTCQYAKKQETSFKKDNKIQWYHPDQLREITSYINQQIAFLATLSPY